MHPVLFHLGRLSLPTFGIFLAAGLMASLALTERTARLSKLSPEGLWNASLLAVVSAFVFSRILLVLAHPHAFARYPFLLLAVPSLTAPGLALTFAATLLWLWTRQIPWRSALDAWMPCGLLLWGFLALGHFAEGSDPGMPTNLPWGIRMPGDTLAQQPVSLLVAGAAFALAAWTFARLRQGRPVLGAGLAGAGLAQVLLSFLRQPAPESFWGMDPLQWVGVALLSAGTLLMVRTSRWTHFSR